MVSINSMIIKYIHTKHNLAIPSMYCPKWLVFLTHTEIFYKPSKRVCVCLCVVVAVVVVAVVVVAVVVAVVAVAVAAVAVAVAVVVAAVVVVCVCVCVSIAMTHPELGKLKR